MLDRVEALPMHTLLFQGANRALNHAIPLRAVWRDGRLVQSAAAHQCGVASQSKHQALVRAQSKRSGHATKRPEASDQGVFQGAAGSASFATSRQVPAL